MDIVNYILVQHLTFKLHYLAEEGRKFEILKTCKKNKTIQFVLLSTAGLHETQTGKLVNHDWAVCHCIFAKFTGT